MRDRKDDIPLLVRFLLGRIGEETGKRIDVVPKKAMDFPVSYSWPGNVRELENALRRAVLLSPGNVLLPETLQL